MADWDIHPLSSLHDKSAFDCVNTVLNEWLWRRAGQWQKKQVTRCYVATRKSESRVFGYYAISSHHVAFESLPPDQARGLPRIDVPVILLGRLAVDNNVRGYGVGKLLLLDALRRSEYLAGQLGILAVEVDAIDDTARQFYLKFGFTPLADDPAHLFLSMHVIRQLGLSDIKPV
jgi:GNAT superfamily N-acetyltransferase